MSAMNRIERAAKNAEDGLHRWRSRRR
jgi:hypothetical protein